MGAVHASEMAPPPTAEADRYVRNKFHAAMYYAYPRNPGTVEELHARWKEMLPQPFEGAKLLVQKGLSNNFQVRNHDLIFFFYFTSQVSHALTMSNAMPSGYRWAPFPKI